MTSASLSAPDPRASGLRTHARRLAAALLVLALFTLVHGGTLAAFLQQGAPLAQPGDRLLVIFPRNTTTPEALRKLGDAGTVLSASGGSYFYLAEIIDRSAGSELARQARALRLPAEPTLQGCFGMVRGD